MSALLFLDTETTGLHPERDEIWEIAAILRDEDGTEKAFHRYVDHSPDLCQNLPKQFWDDHHARYPIDCLSGETRHRDAFGCSVPTYTRSAAAVGLIDFVGGGRPHLVGAVPSFDTERLGRLIYGTQGQITRMPWHYHVIDVEALAVGYLRAQNQIGQFPDGVESLLPWNSDDLSSAVGVDPEKFDRHTALGDVEWAMAIYDAVMGGAR